MQELPARSIQNRRTHTVHWSCLCLATTNKHIISYARASSTAFRPNRGSVVHPHLESQHLQYIKMRCMPCMLLHVQYACPAQIYMQKPRRPQMRIPHQLTQHKACTREKAREGFHACNQNIGKRKLACSKISGCACVTSPMWPRIPSRF